MAKKNLSATERTKMIKSGKTKARKKNKYGRFGRGRKN